jgi:hypothetical protein
MLLISSVSIGCFIVFFILLIKNTNPFLQTLFALLALFFLCLSVKFSILPLESVIIITLVLATQRLHLLNRIS